LVTVQSLGYEFPEFPYPANLGIGWLDFVTGDQVRS
jgi:hypothetical protein